MHARGPWADMELATLTPQLGSYFGTEKGVLVVRAPKEPGFPLEDGDVILAIEAASPRAARMRHAHPELVSAGGEGVGAADATAQDVERRYDDAGRGPRSTGQSDHHAKRRRGTDTTAE